MILVTGATGFVGAEILRRASRRGWRTRGLARHPERAEALGRLPHVELFRGDVSRPDELDEALEGVEAVVHLVGIIAETARQSFEEAHVEGTRNVLRFADGCPNLRRHQYVSTCYVSGRHCGPFAETDLDVGQSFNNFYEETKFLAEVEVAAARDGGMPTTVYRPAIVVGDSRTGDTQKFDGPYFLLQWLLRQPEAFALVPLVGDPAMVRFNMVPSDFVIDAIEHLSALDSSVGRTYQLADPRPLTVDELLTEMCRATGRRGVRVALPHRLTTWTLANVPPVERWVGIPADAVEYFVHPTHYGTAQAGADLAGSGVACPPVADYLPNLVRFMMHHRSAEVGVMV